MTAVQSHRDTQLELLSQLMDNQFRIPGVGWRFGLNTLLDLIPGIGDASTSLVAVAIMMAAVRRGVSRPTLLHMAMNIAIYSIGGILPLVGDVFDTWWKPNMRNMALLQRAQSDKVSATRSDWLFVGGVCLILVLGIFASMALLWSLIHALYLGVRAPAQAR